MATLAGRNERVGNLNSTDRTLALLRPFGVTSVDAGSALDLRGDLDNARGLHVALERAHHANQLPASTRVWIERSLRRLAGNARSDDCSALLAEVEAALRLSWIGELQRVPESNQAATPDFDLGGLWFEVFCPQKHVHERKVAQLELQHALEKQTGPVRVASVVTHPNTGSGRSVDASGQIRHDPKNRALKYPANKIIDRILHKKRDARQWSEGEVNLLWLDLKWGLGMRVQDCAPFSSVIAKGHCFTGTTGVWHAFYGTRGASFFEDRTVLEFPLDPSTYEQQSQGWFRETPKVSAAVLSLRDGTVLFENPWATTVLGAHQAKLLCVPDLRPEASWFAVGGDADSLVHEVRTALAKIERLASLHSQSSRSGP